MRNIPSNGDNIIDSRDIIKRIEELELERDAIGEQMEEDGGITLPEWLEGEGGQELKVLLALAEEGSGSPDWSHGETLISDSYFETYAQELAEDCGMMTGGDKWPYTCIDWDKAADELKQDYSSIDFDGETYWIRS